MSTKTLAEHIIATISPMITLLMYLEDNPHLADAFATEYPFTESYDEMIARVVEWAHAVEKLKTV